MQSEESFLEVLAQTIEIAEQEKQTGATEVSFSTDEKRRAIMIANHLRSKYDCYIQEMAGLWYAVAML